MAPHFCCQQRPLSVFLDRASVMIRILPKDSIIGREMCTVSGLFGSLFDFNGDGELSTGEKAFGFAAMMSALSALEDAEVSVSCSFDDEDLDDMDRDELEAKLEELRDERDELDDQEPDDCLSDAYDEWEERCDELDSRIEELEELLDD